MNDSPSTTPLQVETAGLLRRFAALGYDWLLLIGLSFGYGGILIFLRSLFVEQADSEGSLAFRLVFQLGWFAMIAGFYVYFWRHGGQTLGMRAWRLRLISEHNNLTLQQCLLRCVLAPLSFLLGGIGYWWRFVDSEKRTVHDKWTKTYVVVMPKPVKNKPLK